MRALALLLLIAMRPGPAEVTALLAESARRRPPVEVVRARQDAIAEATALLRAFYYPKQRAMCRSTAKMIATSKTRRAGATAGWCRELLARALETPGFRATYAATTRIEARARAWESDTKSGLVDLLREYGQRTERAAGVEQFELAGVTIDVRDAELTLEFSNGSELELFGADTERAINKKRGGAKHVFWIDEAQDFRFLQQFYKRVAVPAMADFDGECWISGTPGVDCAGMFYDITTDDETARMPGWEVHTIAVVDNPFFGRVVLEDGRWFVVDNIGETVGPFESEVEAEAAAVEVRWNRTAGDAIKKNGWALDDPDLLREWYARWVRTDARYVYPVGARPLHTLTFAPMRTIANPWHADHPGWYDHERSVTDLPRGRRGRELAWMFAIGADFGYFPDPFALVVWAFSFDRPDIFEMFSWKQQKVLPDDQRDYVQALWKTIPNIVVLVGDPGGQAGANMEGWRQRLQLPIEDADKASKNTWQELMAGDIRKGLIHYREGSPLLHEHKHLVYLPTKPGKTRKEHKERKIADGSVPGNHCSDAGLYSHRHLSHHMFKARTDAPPPGSPAALIAEEKQIEARVDAAEQTRKAAPNSDENDGWDQIDSGGYGYG